MKLIEEVLSKENLNKAYLQVFRNKGSAGVDGVSVNELKEHLRVNGDKIIGDIKKRKYKPLPVKRVEIPKDNGKKRLLGIPTVVDRVIQQALA
jgi:retron-type reverse transcriptase